MVNKYLLDQKMQYSYTDDLKSGLVVFLVALPLCLGVALASNAPLLSGIISGIVGGLVVTFLSGSETSVSGPAAGLTAVVAAQILTLGSYERFLVAVVLAGLLQIFMGVARAGFIASVFPTSVIKGLLAAIGVILILKQIPHLLGHDWDPEGDMAFSQVDHENTFTEIFAAFGDFHYGTALIGILSLIFLLYGAKIKFLKKSPVPLPLAVVIFGVVTNEFYKWFGGSLIISAEHLVQVPVAESLLGWGHMILTPDFSDFWFDSKIYMAALTIAGVASLETLLNLEAIDKIDPKQRVSPPNRELIAQGIGNTISGLLGGLPLTSVIVRSAVNISSGARSKNSSFFHGLFLLASVLFLPHFINLIPLSCLAAILFSAGLKLVSPSLVRQMLKAGVYQWVPFMVTVVAILFTDLLVGVGIGFLCSMAFFLHENYRRPVPSYLEKHINTEVLRIELPFQMSSLGRAALMTKLNDVKEGSHILIDATRSVFIDSDIIAVIYDFKSQAETNRNIKVSLRGFEKYPLLADEIKFEEFPTSTLQAKITPEDVLRMLQEGNKRFTENRRVHRDHGRQVAIGAHGQHPLAVVLHCIDSRTPAEIVFDTGLGDIFSVRVAGNIISEEVLGSLEFCIGLAKAKLIVVMGHTHCGAIAKTVETIAKGKNAEDLLKDYHLSGIVNEINKSIDDSERLLLHTYDQKSVSKYVDQISERNVKNSINEIMAQSKLIRASLMEKEAMIVGAVYNVSSGATRFIPVDQFSASYQHRVRDSGHKGRVMWNDIPH